VEPEHAKLIICDYETKSTGKVRHFSCPRSQVTILAYAEGYVSKVYDLDLTNVSSFTFRISLHRANNHNNNHEASGKDNFGIVDRFDNREQRITLDGKVITVQELREKLIGSNLTDDRTKPRLTFIGPKSDIEKFRAYAERNKQLTDKFLIQCYQPDSWEVTTGGFYVGGNLPVVYIQTFSGRVLHRHSGHLSDDEFNRLLERVLAENISSSDTRRLVRERKPHDNYNPNEDRNLLEAAGTISVATIILLAIIAWLVWEYWHKKNQKPVVRRRLPRKP
jgi:hypothetical protein